MEIFELNYFLEVAKLENIHRASERLRISPSSLSKAIARLEAELDVLLFHREGRTLQLSKEGKLLKVRAAEILKLEENTRQEISGKEGSLHAVIYGPEMLLSAMGPGLVEKIQRKHPDTYFELIASDEITALEKVEKKEAHLALTTLGVPAGLTTKTLGHAKFLTVVGRGHPLFSKSQGSLDVTRVLEHPFVSASHPILGKVEKKQSPDGWRDDEFPRKIQYLTSSLSLILQLVEEGKAVAYLPDYLVKNLKVEVLKVKGCPYTCTQEIKLVARRPEEKSWLKQLFS